MLQILSANDVKFLLVGAYAMGAYGHPRATGDIDIWVWATAENSGKIYNSLKQFGAPLAQINQDSFTEKGIVFQIGVAPRRIDILSRIDGVDFEDAYEKRQITDIDGIAVPLISKQHLIKNKLATGRKKDALDAEQLK
jgi:hypothetical protein